MNLIIHTAVRRIRTVPPGVPHFVSRIVLQLHPVRKKPYILSTPPTLSPHLPSIQYHVTAHRFVYLIHTFLPALPTPTQGQVHGSQTYVR